MESSTNTNIRNANHQYENVLHFTECIFSGIPVVKKQVSFFFTLCLCLNGERKPRRLLGSVPRGQDGAFPMQGVCVGTLISKCEFAFSECVPFVYVNVQA